MTLVPGTIWEAITPDGEIVEVLIKEVIPAEGEDTFSFVRAIPLTAPVITQRANQTLIFTETTFYTAHCWLEGPVANENLRRYVARITHPSFMHVLEACACESVEMNLSDCLLQASLHEQFNPLFSSAWEKLYVTVT